MSLNGHIVELQRRHHELKIEIEKEEKHPASDPFKLAELKRKKLILKDEIAKFAEKVSLH